MKTRELLIFISKNPDKYPLGTINSILSQIPEHEAAQYAALGAGMDYLSEGGRDAPFQPKLDLQSIDPNETQKDRNDLNRVYQRATDEGIAASLLERMGSDGDRPESTALPSLAETIEASLALHGE